MVGPTRVKSSSPPPRPANGPTTRRKLISRGTPDASRSSSRGQAAGGGAPGSCPGPGDEPASSDGPRSRDLSQPCPRTPWRDRSPLCKQCRAARRSPRAANGYSVGSRRRPSRAERTDVLAPVHQMRPTHGRVGSAPASEAENRGDRSTDSSRGGLDLPATRGGARADR